MSTCSRKSKECPKIHYGNQQHLLMPMWVSRSKGQSQDHLALSYTSALHILGPHILNPQLKLSVTGSLVSVGRTRLQDDAALLVASTDPSSWAENKAEGVNSHNSLRQCNSLEV